MKNESLGKLKPVELRDVWDDESHDFTPWLAQEENISLLGKTIGIELEVEAQEQDVGPFRADILCKDTATDAWVLIENQLERTDHTHLGQLLTYAAGLDVVTVIWIAKNFSDEHRATLDWLNEITDERINFFGLEVQLWRIGDSPIAPKFNIISMPNDWSKTIAGEVSRIQHSALTETKKLQLAFWQAFNKYLKESGSTIRPTKPLPQHWMSIAIGRSGFNLSAVASAWDSVKQSYSSDELRAEIVIYDVNSKVFFELLEGQKEEIESEMGKEDELTWYNPPESRNCRIYLRRSADISNQKDWSDQHEWLRSKLEALHRVFAPRIKKLDLEGL